MPMVWTPWQGTINSPSPGPSGGRPSRPRIRRQELPATSTRLASTEPRVLFTTRRRARSCTRSITPTLLPAAAEASERADRRQGGRAQEHHIQRRENEHDHREEHL